MSFDEFRRELEGWCLAKLRKERPRYVAKLEGQFSLTSDLVTAQQVASSELGDPMKCMVLLAHALDVDLSRDNLVLATELTGIAPPDEKITLGSWVVHHADMWSIRAVGYLDRIDRLGIATTRQLIASQSQRIQAETAMKARIAPNREKIEALRNAAAHGSGPVEALQAERQWETHLVLETDGFRKIIQSYHEDCAKRQAPWHDGFVQVSSILIKDADDWFDELSKNVF